MKNILLLGAGKSATCLISYLMKACTRDNWQLTIADSNPTAVRERLGQSPVAIAVQLNVENEEERKALVQAADIVISLLPPQLHFLVAKDCLQYAKNLLTASYIDDNIRSLQPALIKKGILFLCEMGLDPGIDHMSAMQIIHRIKSKGGRVKSFHSHCGGLVAPESDDNPWRYKISWNPRNIVMAGKGGAIYVEDGEEKQLGYESLFDANRVVHIEGLGLLSWYPNRDSRPYRTIYELQDVPTFIRTTLRYPEFCFGWKNIIELNLTDENPQYDSEGMSLQEFFQMHFAKYGFAEWLQKQLTSRFENTRHLLDNLMQLLDAENEAEEKEKQELNEFMMVDEAGKLEEINLDEVKNTAAATMAGQMHEANLAMKQLFFLGMDDRDTLINKARCSAADCLQVALESKLALKPGDKDMIVMLHQIEYEQGDKNFLAESSLVVKGADHMETAMAKTVGLPLGIAAILILQGKIQLKGLHIPILPEVYVPLLKALEEEGISFKETVKEIAKPE